MLVPGLLLPAGTLAGDLSCSRDSAGDEDLIRIAMEYSRVGEIEVRNLPDSGDDQEPRIRRLARRVPCRVWTEVPDEDKARRLLRSGVRKLVIPAHASRDLLSRLPRGRIVLGLRTADGRHCMTGEGASPLRPALEWMQVLAPCCSGFRLSFEDSEGTLLPPDLEALQALTAALRMEFTVAARVSSPEEVRRLDRLGCDLVVDEDQVRGRFSFSEAFVACLDFPEGGVPAVLVDRSGQVLRLERMDRDRLLASLESGRISWSCATEGACQNDPSCPYQEQGLIRVLAECRRDTVVVVVDGVGRGCRLGRYSCFGSGAREFNLQRLYEIIAARRAEPRPGSYSSFLFEKEDRIPRKLTEEMFELLTARGRDDLTWEAADVMFFLLTYLVRHEVSLDEVIAELGGRER